MRQASLFVISLALVGAATFASGAAPAAAQQGVSVEMLGQGTLPEAGGQQLTMLRVTFAPGGELRPHRHPGPMLVYIESGALTYTLMDGAAEIVRATAAGSTAPPEMLAAGGGTVLQVGDQLLERDVLHVAYNTEAEPAVVLISALLAPGQPVTQFVESAP